jgi:DNA-binding NarL/FixJ family response regulator
LFVLGALEKPTSLTLQFFCQAHRLTSAEGTVLDGLCRGLSPSQVAARGGVTVATVRSQITAIRSKTQTASLAHLLRMVAALPPLAQASALDR